MHSRHHECQQEKATCKRVNTAIIFDNHNQSNEISYYIMNVSRKKRLANVLATTKKRYSDTTIQRYRNRNLEPEPGTVHNICKLENFAPQEIYIIIIYRGGAQFNDSIKYYMQGILMFKLLTVTKQRMNIVVALHGKTIDSKTFFVIARPFFLSVLI